MCWEIGGLDIEAIVTRETQHILILSVPSDTIRIRFLKITKQEKKNIKRKVIIEQQKKRPEMYIRYFSGEKKISNRVQVGKNLDFNNIQCQPSFLYLDLDLPQPLCMEYGNWNSSVSYQELMPIVIL